MLESFIRNLKEDPHFASTIAAVRVLDAEPARARPFECRDDLRQALDRLGITGLFSHQTDALRRARAREDFVVATPTASGKTLCFNLPVVESILNHRDRGEAARALYLFPLKALERDQHKNLVKFQDALSLHEPFGVSVYDGDTKEAERKNIRKAPPHILITNPDMLHASILPHHDTWRRFFAALRFIVLDELHTYRGVFGSHVLHVLRRLLRIAAHYGSRPQIIAASATIDNPGQLAAQLFGRRFHVIDQSGAPQGPRSVMLMNPPDQALSFAVGLFSSLVARGIKTIAFCKSRRATELLFRWSMDRRPELGRRVSAYRSGYLPQERRKIEAELFGGRLTGVVSTSALEMGIDVGGLDAAVLVGYPGSIMSTWQRAGRAGRGQAPAALFLVAGHDALDQYYIGEPGAFFRARPEAAVVDASNESIRNAHMLCAGAELPLSADELAYEDLDWKRARVELQRKGLLLQSVAGDAWVPLMPRPHREVDIRQIGDTYTIHAAFGDRNIIGTVGGSRVFAECHEGAVYLHRGRHYAVQQLDLEKKRAFVESTDGSVFTVARSAKQTEILDVLDSRTYRDTTVRFGRLRITQRITGYEKRSSRDQKLLGTFELELPPVIYETQGLWIEIPDELHRQLEAKERHRMGSLHAIEHAMIALSPLFTLCDAADLGGITFVEHPQVPGGAIFLYDSYPGGIGLSARCYEILPRVLQTVLDVVRKCRCDSGCPGCIHSPRCGAGNYPLDKHGSREALAFFLDAERPAAVPGEIRPDWAAAKPLAAAAEVPDPEPQESLAWTNTGEVPALPTTGNGDARDVLYFDLETLYSAKQVGGWRRIDQMGMALGVVYAERQGNFEVYHESDVHALVERLIDADLVVGYNLLRFDYRVLSAYTNANLERIPTFDMLVELHELLGRRLKLSTLADVTLGTGKSADGLQSLEWVRQGRLDLVEEYCRKDVELTRDLFRYGVHHGRLAFERDGMALHTPPFAWNLEKILQEAAQKAAARRRISQGTLFEPSRPRPSW